MGTSNRPLWKFEVSERKEVGRATERGRRRARARLWVVLSVLALLALALPGQEARALPTVIATIPVGTAPDGIDVSPDGTKVYVVNIVSLDVSVIDTTTNTVIATFANPGGNPGTPRDLAFTPDGTEVWVGSGGCVDCIRIFSYPTNAPVATVSGIIGGGTWIDFLPDGSFAFANNGCGQCGNVQKISTTSNSVVSTLFHGGHGAGLAVAPNGSAVYAGSGLFAPPQIKRIDPSSFSVTGSVPLPAVGEFAITPDGGFLYVAIGSPDQVLVVDTSNLTVVDSITVGTDPKSVSISPDGSRAYVPNVTSDDVSVIDTATNTVVATVAVGDHPVRAAISADGTHIYVTNTGSNTVSVIQVDESAPVVNVSFPSPNGQNGWFVTSPVTGSVAADDTTTGGNNVTAITCTGATVGPITGLGTPSASAPLVVSAEGMNNVSCTASDSAGNSGAASGSNNAATVQIDTIAPGIVITSPAGRSFSTRQ